MNKTFQMILGILVVIIIGIGAYFIFSKKVENVPSNTSTSTTYSNTTYGFSVQLPEDWVGYSIVADTWVGNPIGSAATYTSGPEILIRNPKWTSEAPYQDIPVMVFTLGQWNDLLAEKFHIGAAPIGPSELGRNSKYVLALPARYNFAYPLGYEEVDQIIQAKSLITFEPK